MVLFCSLGVFLLRLCPLVTAISAVMNNSSTSQPPPLFQIIDLHVTEKDIEKEHHNQLRRWKETHGDLRSKSPPRMHGAKAILIAEPPRLQDLKQRPNIKVQSPLAPKQDGGQGKFNHKTEVRQENNTPPPQPDALPLLKHSTYDGSKDSMSSTEHDTYL